MTRYRQQALAKMEPDNFLFSSSSLEEEKAIRLRLVQFQNQLQAIKESGETQLVTLFGRFAKVVSDLLDIGASPDLAELTRLIRIALEKYGQAQVNITPDGADNLLEVLNKGIMRHENGASDPNVVFH